MSFNDLPKVDNNAKRCEESVLFVRQIFSMENGFISREQYPDYGIDLLVELMSKSGGATSKDFAIQVKSCIESETVVVNDFKFVPLEFETSRLGHLCRRPPAYGIVVLYDKKNKTAYYDFVEKMVTRATIERNGDAWKNNEKVTIHFPIANVLDQKSVKKVYDIYTQLFINHDLLTATLGSFFNIPFLAAGIGTQITGDYKEPVQFLQKYGGYLINNNEYRFAFRLLSSIPLGHVLQSKELLFLASIVYSQCGYYIEAKTFIALSLAKHFDWNEQQSALLEITSFRLSFATGLCSMEEFSANLKKVQNRLTDDQNIAMIASQQLHMKFLFAIKKHGCVKAYINPIVEEIKNLVSGLNNKKMSKEAKLLLTLDVAYYLAEAAHFQFAHDVSQLRMKEKLSIPFPVEERIEKAKYIAGLLEQSYQMATTVLNESETNKLETTKAHALYIICNNFFQFEFNSYILNTDVDKGMLEEGRQLFIKNMDRIVLAAQLFQKNNLLEDTHNILCLASDTNSLYKALYGDSLPNFNDVQTSKLLTAIEKETGIVRKKSILDMVKPFNTQTKIVSEDKCFELSDEEIEKFSLTLVETLNILDCAPFVEMFS